MLTMYSFQREKTLYEDTAYIRTIVSGTLPGESFQRSINETCLATFAGTCVNIREYSREAAPLNIPGKSVALKF